MREPPGWLPPLADSLAEALPRLHGVPADPLIGELILALTAALERGEVELPLAGPPPEGIALPDWPAAHCRALRTSPLCRDPEGPLALEGDRLLWRRWQQRRERVLEELIRRATSPPISAAPSGGIVEQPPALDPRQWSAVEAVLRHGLVLLEGGPGTGKTSTVAAMLAAVLKRHPDARLHLGAPTGKAAARLRSATGGLWPCTTLHRLLESRGEHFGRDRRHPLALDLLVVDEVSMVDLALIEAVLEALPATCRLVLVGDPAQLPPIAPGPLLLELQRPGVRQALAGAVITLRTPYRNEGVIAAAAADLRAAIERQEGGGGQDPMVVLRPHLERRDAGSNLRWHGASPRRVPPMVLRLLEEHAGTLAALATGLDPQDGAGGRQLLEERDRLLVLSPQRSGPWGLEALHAALLGEAAAGSVRDWPAGTPVLCTRNLPELGLANGDVGVLVGQAGDPDRRWLLFGDGGGDPPLWVHPAQLAGAAEPALALTVHKAQGSEAEEVVVLMPPGEQRDPRLLYTALTRARRRALLITPADEARFTDHNIGQSANEK
jgi:exodeoxyribonuclease V alpha subunit